MRPETIQRTKAYFDWAANRESYQSLDRSLDNGIYVESLARRAANGALQTFVGVYTSEGKPIREEYRPDVQGPDVGQAIAEGIKRGLELGQAHQV